VFEALGCGVRTLPETEAAAREVLSLPLYPGLTAADQDRVIAAILAYFSGADSLRDQR
jgi:dTDP-4-amino-4,6-dideoxygalactose transaminase